MKTAAGALLLATLLLATLAALVGRRASALPALPTHHQQQQPTCGFSTCHELKEGMLNVHLVPHSHDDVGWLKTLDQYYYGENNYIQRANVSRILDSVFGQLIQDPNKRYIQVETAYLWMWWQHQDETTRDQYRQLVQTGRVQITGGGWSMPDEATTNYQSLIDNFSWGFKFLNDSFGPCGVPNVGWQIDPFGHSRETASIMAAMGLQGTFVNRLDYEDYALRRDTSNLEMMWLASNNTGRRAHIFTSALYDHYGPPPNCCWDTLCDDEEISNGTDYIIDGFISYVQEKAKHFATNNIMLTMGNDFNYMDARKYYTNIDRLITLINNRQRSGGNLNLVYSTPSCYLKAVHDARPTLSTKSDDFLPYASEVDGYWSGYFTSRPTLKFFERLGNNFLQVCKQLSVLSGVARQDSSALDDLRRAMGLLQHHDAITGTEKKAVAQDYARILTSGMSRCGELAQEALNALLGPVRSDAAANTTSVEIKSCLLLNISQCDVSEQNENFIVTVYNPLSRVVSHYVRLPVKVGTYSVTDLDGATQATQTVPIPAPVLQLSDRHSDARQELVFRAADLPPLGVRIYRVTRTSSNNTATGHQTVADSHIGNQYLRVEINRETGLLTTIVANGTTVPVAHNMFYYDAFDGYNGESGMRCNGAYVFRPQHNVATEMSSTATYSVYKGEHVEEIHQVFNYWTSQVIRIYRDEEYVEFEWLVGPVRNYGAGVQPISRFSTGLKSRGTFYTDSNGREMLTRKKNYRPTWNLTVSEPVAGNYYPVTSRILVKDEEQNLELAVLTDRSQGGSSLEDGQIELMLHRRLGKDDGMGVAENLNDAEPARGKHYVVLGQPSSSGKTSAAKQRLLAQSKLLQPWVFLSPADNWPTNYKHQISGLNAALPENVQLLTLEPWGGSSVLLRLEHILEKNDDAILSQTATVDIENILAGWTVTSVRETTLDGTQWLSDIHKLAWNTTGESAAILDVQQESEGSTILLSPMQIRTFIVDVALKRQ